jgi:hypothetical protein
MSASVIFMVTLPGSEPTWGAWILTNACFYVIDLVFFIIRLVSEPHKKSDQPTPINSVTELQPVKQDTNQKETNTA